MVVFDDESKFTNLGDFYMQSISDALFIKNQSNNSSESVKRLLVLHWMKIDNSTSDDEYFNLVFDNVEIGLQVLQKYFL